MHPTSLVFAVPSPTMLTRPPRFTRYALALIPFVAPCRLAYAQESAPSAVEEEIVITADPPPERVAPIRAPVSQRMFPSAARTVEVHVASDGVLAEVSFVPISEVVPRDAELNYFCRTPCDVAVWPGTYHIVTRSSAGRFVRLVEVRHDTQFFVTPRTSRALGLGLLIPGGVSAVAGITAFILGATTASSYSYSYSYYGYRPDLTPYWVTGSLLTISGLAFAIAGGYLLRGTGGSVRNTRGPETAASRQRPQWSAAVVPLGEGGALGSASITF